MRKSITLLALVLALIIPTLAASYSYSADNRLETTAENGEITISGLNPSTNYTLQAIDSNNAYRDVKDFSTDSNGNAVVSYNINLSKSFSINKDGYRHRIKNNTFSENFTVKQGINIQYFNSYYDNTVNKSLYSISGTSLTSLSEKNGYLFMDAGGSDNIEITPYEALETGETMVINASVRKTSGNAQGRLEFYQDVGSNYVGNALYLDNSKKVYYLVNKQNEVLALDSDGNTINSYSVSDDTIYIRFNAISGSNNQNNNVKLYEMSYIDSRLRDKFNEPLNFKDSGSYEWNGYKNDNNRDTGLEFTNDKTSGYTPIFSDLNTDNNVRIRNNLNESVKMVSMHGTYQGEPPSITDFSISPKPVSYGSTPNIYVDTADNDSSVSKVEYKLDLDGSKYAEGSLDASGTNSWEKQNAFDVQDTGDYVLTITATDTDGNTDTYTYKFNISSFETQFDFDELGTWSNEAITPNLNRSGFKMTWSGYNSSKVNYTYGTLDVYLESLDRNKSVYLSQPERFDFRNNSIDHENGTVNYFLDFTRLTDYEATNRLLGDDLEVRREFNLRNSTGDTVKTIVLADRHKSVEKEGGFFNAFWEVLDSFIPNIGGLGGIGDAVNDILDGLLNLPSNIASAIQSLIDGAVNSVETFIQDVIDLVDSIVTGVWQTLADLVAAAINGISYAVGWILNFFDISIWSIQNYGLTVSGNVSDTNETFTYYNYSGVYNKRLNETSMTFLETTFREYSISNQYSSYKWLSDNNVNAGNITGKTAFVLYDITTVNGTQRNATIKTYSRPDRIDLPNGISLLSFGVDAIISAFGSFFTVIISYVPNPIVAAVEAFFNLGAAIFGTFYRFITIITAGLNFIFGKGWNWTVMAIKYYALFKVGIYAKELLEAWKGNKEVHTAVNYVLQDLENQIKMLNDFVWQTFDMAEEAIGFVLHVIKTVASWIPFL